MAGWIKISRDINRHWIWSNEKYLRWWIDLLLTAAWDNEEMTHDNHVFTLEKGQMVMSVNDLCLRWKASRNAVLRFLQMCEGEDMLIREVRYRQTPIITICNYERYQCNEKVKKDRQRDRQRDRQAKEEIENSPHTPFIRKEENRKIISKEDIPPLFPPRGYEIFNFDFLNMDFKDSFFMWLDYKRDTFKDKYKTQKSLEACYKNLIKLSDNNPSTALEIVNQSMANNWKGLFEIKNEQRHGNNRTNAEQREAAEFDKAARLIARLDSENQGGYDCLWQQK